MSWGSLKELNLLQRGHTYYRIVTVGWDAHESSPLVLTKEQGVIREHIIEDFALIKVLEYIVQIEDDRAHVRFVEFVSNLDCAFLYCEKGKICEFTAYVMRYIGFCAGVLFYRLLGLEAALSRTYRGDVVRGRELLTWLKNPYNLLVSERAQERQLGKHLIEYPALVGDLDKVIGKSYRRPRSDTYHHWWEKPFP